MMEVLKRVREFSRGVVEKAGHVTINHDDVVRFVDQHLNLDVNITPGTEELTFGLVLEELIANSVNYCYWYGRHDWRPGGASARRMYELLSLPLPVSETTEAVLQQFFWQLAVHRFPLLEERRRHLKELEDGDTVLQFVRAVLRQDLDGAFNTLLLHFPGYASDVFLKRAQLLFMMIHRRTGALDEEWVRKLTVPVDYQLPKVLRAMGCLVYDMDLERMVDVGEPIPRGSKWEVEIRASTLQACDAMSSLTGLSTCVIDEVLWGMRNITTTPFHLTVTTDY